MSERRTDVDDQISLIGVRSFLNRLLQTAFEFQSFIFLAIRRKIWFIVIGLLIGIVLGLVYHGTRQEFYKASMVLTYNKLSKKTYAEIIEQLDILAGSGSTTKLASELELSENLTGNILFIESRNINNDLLDTDTSQKVNQPFKVIFGLRKNAISIDSFQNALVTYINNRPYLKKIAENDRRTNLYKLEYINSNLQKLDSLKTEFTRFLAATKVSTFYNNAINPAEIYAQSDNLVNQRDQVQRMLNVEPYAVSVIDDLKVSKTSHSISRAKALFILGSAGLLIGFLIGLLIETKRKVLPSVK